MSIRIPKQHPVMRKEPRQNRSRATVEAILRAGARVLSDAGWAGFTTNRVADLAGVSIGSLYQYFPDKLSLVDAIRRRHIGDCLSVIREYKDAGLPPAQFAETLVRAMIATHSVYPGLHRVLLDEAPSSDDHRNPNSEFEIEYLGYYMQAISSCRKRGPSAADHTTSLIISDAIDGVIHNAARRNQLGDPVIQTELARLIRLYLEDTSDVSAANVPRAQG